MKNRGIHHWVRLGKSSESSPNYQSAQVTLTDGRTITVYNDGTVGIQCTAPCFPPDEMLENWTKPGD